MESLVSKVSNPKTEKNSWIEDSSGILNNREIIDNLISENESQTGVEIADVILPTIDGYIPKDFAVALFNHWKIGKKDKDNGILILHILDQRRIEIETGYGLEGDLPDVIVKRIIDTYSIPAFKEGDFSKGHLETVTALIRKLNHPDLEIDELLSEERDKNNPDEKETIETPKRTDLYDYQGKKYDQLTQKELKIFDACIEKYNITSDYFLTDEENRLLAERNSKLEEIERKKVLNFKIYLAFGYLILLTSFFLLQQILYWSIPSPNFKYRLIRYSDFPLFYGFFVNPLLLFILVFSHFFEEMALFASIFFSIASYVIYNLFWGNLRLERLSKRLLHIRNIPRKCPDCKQPMVKLSEKADDAHLSKGQISEEIVKSIDYDVWICPNCSGNLILPFPNIDPEFIYKGVSFPKIKKCPECNFETLVCRKSQITQSATYSSSGKVAVYRKCKHCAHELTEMETIPKKQKSSSSSSGGGGSSGGSFGGGSSGGGGSGGSY